MNMKKKSAVIDLSATPYAEGKNHFGNLVQWWIGRIILNICKRNLGLVYLAYVSQQQMAGIHESF